MNTEGFGTIDAIWQTLVRATVDRKHAWRVAGFATQGMRGPDVRNVILRKVLPPERRLIFFTDARSQKMRDIQQCESVALLFWNPAHQLQLRARGVAVALDDPAQVDRWWSGVPEHARRDYGSVNAPGTVVADVNGISYELALAREHFVVLTVTLTHLDCLKLDRERHIRLQYGWNENQQAWTHNELIP